MELKIIPADNGYVLVVDYDSHTERLVAKDENELKGQLDKVLVELKAALARRPRL